MKPGEDFTQAGEELAGLIPAEIEQAVSRALIRGELKYGKAEMTSDTLLAAARAVQQERAQFKHVPEPSPIQAMGAAFGQGIGDGLLALVNGNGHEVAKVH